MLLIYQKWILINKKEINRFLYKDIEIGNQGYGWINYA